MRYLPALILFAALDLIAADTPRPVWPPWDGVESIEHYARRVNLPPTKTLDLGDGVQLELVLIPAGTFTMGTPEPAPIDEEPFVNDMWIGLAGFAGCTGVLFVLVVFVIIRANRAKRWPQLSLARLLIVAAIAGGGLLGFLHYNHSVRAYAEAQTEYQAALTRFQHSHDWGKASHVVTISAPYYLGRFEVTQKQYQQVMGSNFSKIKGPDLPAEFVLWTEAQEFCEKANGKTGWSIRLPTEAEWEHACRAGTRTAYYTGDSAADLERIAWYRDNSSGRTHPVGQKTPNAWGLYDAHGNVWEWCSDWFEEYRRDTVVDPVGPPEGFCHVLRSGAWYREPKACRSAFRGMGDELGRMHGMGFRIATSVPKTP